jgi:hypothetical protein
MGTDMHVPDDQQWGRPLRGGCQRLVGGYPAFPHTPPRRVAPPPLGAPRTPPARARGRHPSVAAGAGPGRRGAAAVR